MNAQSFNAHMVSGFDPMRVDDGDSNCNRHRCLWHPSGPKPLTLTSMVAVCLPMPVWSCSKTSMTNSVSRATWRPCYRTRAMHDGSTLP